MDNVFGPFREALQFSIHQVLIEIRHTFSYADIATISCMSAPMLSKVASGNSTLVKALTVADTLRIGYSFSIVNGVVDFHIEPLDVVIARCLAPGFTLKRRNKP